jgi:hypothetical protein
VFMCGGKTVASEWNLQWCIVDVSCGGFGSSSFLTQVKENSLQRRGLTCTPTSDHSRGGFAFERVCPSGD